MPMLFIFLAACSDAEPPDVDSKSEQPMKNEPIEAPSMQEPLEFNDESLKKTSVLLQALSAKLKSDGEKRKLDTNKPGKQKRVYEGEVCGVAFQSSENTTDFQQQRMEKQREKIEAAKKSRRRTKKRGTAKPNRLRQKAQNAYAELEEGIEQKKEQEENAPKPLAQRIISHQPVPETAFPCVKQTRQSVFDQAHILESNHRYTVQVTVATYTCTGGDFTHKVEIIELHGETMPQTDLFSEVRKQCSITETGESEAYTLQIRENAP